MRRARFLQRLDRHKEALTYAQEAFQLHPSNVDSAATLSGLLYHFKRDLDARRTIEHFKEFVEKERFQELLAELEKRKIKYP